MAQAYDDHKILYFSAISPGMISRRDDKLAGPSGFKHLSTASRSTARQVVFGPTARTNQARVAMILSPRRHALAEAARGKSSHRST